MVIISKQHIVIAAVCALAAWSCGGPRGETAKTGFALKISSVVSGTPLTGGVKVLCKSSDPTVPDYKTTLDANYSATLPRGSWDIYLVGYTGPEAWAGTNYCGTVNYNIAKETETINISLTVANCSLAVYQNMINDGKAQFDLAIFDQDVFAP